MTSQAGLRRTEAKAFFGAWPATCVLAAPEKGCAIFETRLLWHAALGMNVD